MCVCVVVVSLSLFERFFATMCVCAFCFILLLSRPLFPFRSVTCYGICECVPKVNRSFFVGSFFSRFSCFRSFFSFSSFFRRCGKSSQLFFFSKEEKKRTRPSARSPRAQQTEKVDWVKEVFFFRPKQNKSVGKTCCTVRHFFFNGFCSLSVSLSFFSLQPVWVFLQCYLINELTIIQNPSVTK